MSNPIPKDLRRRIEDYGASVAGSREIDYGTQYYLERGQESVRLNVYTTGKVAIQGKSSRLKEILECWKETREGGRRRGGAARPVGATPRLGIDEAGKGDYFGPLVVAGARIPDAEVEARLIEIGVRDSKLLKSDESTRRISSRLLDLLGAENVYIVALSPPEYEARRKAAGNVNRLLAETDAGIIEKLKGDVRVVVVDEFARDTRSLPGTGHAERGRARGEAEGRGRRGGGGCFGAGEGAVSGGARAALRVGWLRASERGDTRARCRQAGLPRTWQGRPG